MELSHLLASLEERVGRALATVTRLKQDNDQLRNELTQARRRLTELEAVCERWEHERSALGGRIERLLADIEAATAVEVEAAGQR